MRLVGEEEKATSEAGFCWTLEGLGLCFGLAGT
jgi:hypothetical protein